MARRLQVESPDFPCSAHLTSPIPTWLVVQSKGVRQDAAGMGQKPSVVSDCFPYLLELPGPAAGTT